MPNRPPASNRSVVLTLVASLVLVLLPAGAGAVEPQALPPIATYADVCDDATATTDLRRLIFGIADESTYGAVVEGCEAGGASDWDLVIVLPDDAVRRVRLRTVGGVSTFTVTDETSPVPVVLYAGDGLRRDDRSIQIFVPAIFLAPPGEELLLRALAGEDQLPDASRPMVVFPSPCAGGAAVQTTALRVTAGSSTAVAAAAAALGLDVGAVDDTLGVVELVDAAPAALAALARRGDVTAVEAAGPMFHAGVIPDDPAYPEQNGLHIIDAPTAWETRTASALRVAVIDDGIDGSRSDLTGRVVAGYDVVRRAPIAIAANSDLGGHGTSVAGVIGARGDDGIGMAGTDWGAALVPVRVFDEAGCASSTDVAVGIRVAADLGARIINLSLGGPSGSPTLDDAIAYAVARDVLLVAAAGNAGPDSEPMHPAVHPDVIAVGATTSSDTIAPYSNQGDHIELTAPGGSSGDGILTLVDRDGYGFRIGTSFSAPFVAGAAALYRAQHTAADRTDVRRALADTAVDLGAAGRDPVFGHGRLDLGALLPLGTDQTGTTDPCDGAPPAGFTDVTAGSVHAASIDCLVHLDITKGLTETTYGPSRSVNRGQMAGFLARLIRVSGGSLPTANPDAFDDDDGTTHEAAINALAAVGVVDGVEGREYRPHTAVNRAQMASFLARAYAHVAGAPLPEGPDAFSDDDGNAHEANINRAVTAGIAKGLPDGTYGPSLVVRRDQMASFLVRLAQALAG